ncbi:uncharacterized protein [Arachis hypogaea]|uniref:uncharacterized protein n=1 Tax=Arachis hypogaea TaxID=3818 RepID=UPI003B2209EB
MHANFHVTPPEELVSVTSPWPFTKWGLDLLGPFPQAPGQVKYLIVRVDYFTKWIEAESLATITAQRSWKFPYKNIIARFGVSHSITTDNGTQFTDSTFRNLVANMKIKHQFTSVSTHRQMGKQRQPRKSHCETPFRLAYGVEAMIPVEVNMQSTRVRFYDEISNVQTHKEELELLPEVQEQARIREAALKQRMTNRYNKKVIRRNFALDDLILTRHDIGVNKSGQGKLAANWKRPYKVIEVLGKGYYKVSDLNRVELPRSWHACNMRRYYS